MIETLLFKQTVWSIPAKTSITLRSGINPIVGDQGSGKSALLYTILGIRHYQISDLYKRQDKEWRDKVLDMSTNRSCSLEVVDGHGDHPSAKKGSMMDSLQSIQESFYANEHSHGETGLALIERAISRATKRLSGDPEVPESFRVKKTHGLILFLDEPEAGLSVRSQIRISKALNDLVAAYPTRVQVLMATHSPILMGKGEAFDMETLAWTPVADFLKRQSKAWHLPAKRDPHAKKPKKRKTT